MYSVVVECSININSFNPAVTVTKDSDIITNFLSLCPINLQKLLKDPTVLVELPFYFKNSKEKLILSTFVSCI